MPDTQIGAIVSGAKTDKLMMNHLSSLLYIRQFLLITDITISVNNSESEILAIKINFMDV